MLRIKQIPFPCLQDLQIIAKRSIHRRGNYYDDLGITPKATQSDIKKAFYKLSMEFHPDKSTGDDVKFRKISAAYEVLGNLKLRRLYDKGYFPSNISSSYQNTREEMMTQDFREMREQFSKKTQDYGSKWTPPTGRTDAFNYDEWTRKHYTESFSGRRSMPNRRRDAYEWPVFRYRPINSQEAATDRLIWLFGFLLLTAVYHSTTRSNWDNPSKPPRPSKEK